VIGFCQSVRTVLELPWAADSRGVRVHDAPPNSPTRTRLRRRHCYENRRASTRACISELSAMLTLSPSNAVGARPDCTPHTAARAPSA
jgi:hypothetical protein